MSSTSPQPQKQSSSSTGTTKIITENRDSMRKMASKLLESQAKPLNQRHSDSKSKSKSKKSKRNLR